MRFKNAYEIKFINEDGSINLDLVEKMINQTPTQSNYDGPVMEVSGEYDLNSGTYKEQNNVNFSWRNITITPKTSSFIIIEGENE